MHPRAERAGRWAPLRRRSLWSAAARGQAITHRDLQGAAIRRVPAMVAVSRVRVIASPTRVEQPAVIPGHMLRLGTASR